MCWFELCLLLLRDRSVPNQLINSRHARRWTGLFNHPEMSLCLCN